MTELAECLLLFLSSLVSSGDCLEFGGGGALRFGVELDVLLITLADARLFLLTQLFNLG